MTDPSRSWDAAPFDRLYAASDDPWGFETSAYEQQKYAATMAALGGRRFHSGFEAGCSIGVLTQSLAQRCNQLLAVDISQAALRLARSRCAGHQNITFARASLPRDWPGGVLFDLLVFSEILYFLDEPDLRETARCARGHLSPGGMVLTVNWLGETDTPITGEAAADIFMAELGLLHAPTLRCPAYRLDVLFSEETAGY